MTAVVVGVATPKEDETGTLSQSSSNGNGTAECLVAPSRPVVGQHHLREEGCSSEMLSSCGDVDDDNDDSANDNGQFQMKGPPLINKQRNASFRQTDAMRRHAF
jgi:hypothetical protein